MVLTLKNFETKININNEIIDSKVQIGISSSGFI